MRLFRNFVYYHFIFPKIDKRGVGIRAGGWKIFEKLISGGGDDYSVLESRWSLVGLSKIRSCNANNGLQDFGEIEEDLLTC